MLLYYHEETPGTRDLWWIATYGIIRSAGSLAGAKGKVNHQLLFVRIAILIDQRDHIWCVVCAEEDGQHELGRSDNENLIIVVAEQCQNAAYANDPYFA